MLQQNNWLVPVLSLSNCNQPGSIMPLKPPNSNWMDSVLHKKANQSIYLAKHPDYHTHTLLLRASCLISHYYFACLLLNLHAGEITVEIKGTPCILQSCIIHSTSFGLTFWLLTESLIVCILNTSDDGWWVEGHRRLLTGKACLL